MISEAEEAAIKVVAANVAVELDQIQERAREALDSLHDLIDEATITQQSAQELLALVGP